MKKIMMRYVAFLLLLIVFNSKAQEVKEFFDKNDYPTDESHSLYYQVGTKKKFFRSAGGRFYSVESFMDTVYTYYTAGKQLRSKVTYANGYLAGPYVMYFESGSLKQSGQYNDDQKSGLFISWYPDGKKQSQIYYLERDVAANDFVDVKFRIMDYWDSLGHLMIVDGNGTCSCYFVKEFGDDVREEGKVSVGLREGDWKGIKGNTLIFEESYRNGEFVKGIRFHPENYSYSKPEVQAEFKGGLEMMYKFIKRNLKYPKKARKSEKEGTVYVQFDVEENGSLSGINVVQSVSEEIDQESIRVLKSMPPWKPGRLRGSRIKSRFILPIKFHLGF